MKIAADRLRLQAQLILAAWGMPKAISIIQYPR